MRKHMDLRFWKKQERNWANLDAFHGRETSSGIHITEAVVLGIPAVYACVRVLAEAIASLPLLVYERFPNGDKERARDFSLFTLLHDQPNSLMTSYELRELIAAHLCLGATHTRYIERQAEKVVALWPLHPDKVMVELKGRELIYKHQNDGAERVYPMEEVLHIRGLSLTD